MQVDRNSVPMAVVRRMARYYRYLCELEKNGVEKISSKAFSQKLGLTASQVRQDFGCFGGFGHRGYGYVVKELLLEVRQILGITELKKCILIGAGNLGKALLSIDFEKIGFELSGIFDSSSSVAGSKIKDRTVLSYNDIEDFCHNNKPQMAIICIPGTSVEIVAKELYDLGIRYFWNFSHYDISLLYPDTVVETVHLNDSLMTLRYRAE